MRTATSLLAIWLLAACSGATDGMEGTAAPVSEIRLSPALGGMKFELPVALVFPEDSTETGYLVEQSGRILLVSDDGGSWSASEFLNIEARVNDRGREEGLLGLALDPDFDSNGYVYVNYTASGPRRTVVSRFEVLTDSPGKADHDSETIILEVIQPYSNHNGGHLLFGPDGYMYIGLGDGGSAGDPKGNGQDPGTLLGSIVRIDVSSADSSSRYLVPSDNPFIGVEGARPEIWAYGLRNPWRFSFDRIHRGTMGCGRRTERVGGSEPDRSRAELRLECHGRKRMLQSARGFLQSERSGGASGRVWAQQRLLDHWWIRV